MPSCRSHDTAEQIKEKLRSVCNSHDGEASQELLSAREKEIIVGVVKGLTNKQIAERLFISAHTVITHRRNIAAKLQIHSPGGPDHLCDRQQTGRAERCEKYDLQQRRTITAVIF